MTDDPSICPICGHPTGGGEYCGACGGHLLSQPPSSRRPHTFAINPSEHVLHPSLASILFPHLPQQRSTRFRLALLVIAAALLVLGYLRLTGPSVAVAAAAVPLLYLLYLYDVGVYASDPLYAIGLSMGLGGLLGVGWALLTGRFTSQTLLLNASPQGAPVSRVIVVAVLFPLVAQALMLLGPLILRFTRQFHDVLDGFVFGSASAIGFTSAVTLVNLFPDLQSGPTPLATSVSFALREVLHGLLVPLIDAGTTGLIGAAIWLDRRPTRRLPRYGWMTTIPVSVLVGALVQVGLGVGGVYVVSVASAILIYIGLAVALLFWVRVALHYMLLSEVVTSDIGVTRPCFHCGRMVPGMAFCPNCGGAAQAMPKLGGHDGSVAQ